MSTPTTQTPQPPVATNVLAIQAASTAEQVSAASTDITDNDEWTEGDFRLSRPTTSASMFPRIIYSLPAGQVAEGQSRKIELKDPQCETSKTVASFLAVIRDGQLGETYPKYHFSPQVELGDESLLKFLDKWDCPSIRTRLSNELCLRIKDYHCQSICPMRLFVVAARADYDDLCSDILYHNPENKWPPGTATEGRRSQLAIWDPKSCSWPSWIHRHCPAPYVLALIHAWEKHENSKEELSVCFDDALEALLQDDTPFGG